VTFTVSGSDYRLIVPVPDPLDAYASSEEARVWGQIGGWSEALVEIHEDWEEGFREVTTDQEGAFETFYDDVPESGEAYIRFHHQMDETWVIYHRDFSVDAATSLPEVEFGFSEHNSVGMWGVTLPGTTITITTPYTEVATSADPAQEGRWDANAGILPPGSLVTVTATYGGYQPNQATFETPLPFIARADDVGNLVWGQIGGWNEKLVEIHEDWTGGYQEVTTDQEGYFELEYTDLPEDTSGHIRFVVDEASGETDAVYHKTFSTHFAVGLVTDGPIVENGHYAEMASEALARAESELGIETTTYTSTDASAYEPNLQQCADEGHALCVSVGFGMAEATWNAAWDNPETRFATVDADWLDPYPPNLRGITFAPEEAAYLAGTLAGLMTKSDTLGVIGGFDFPPVNVHVYGFRNGASCANPWATTIISYTDSFMDPELGAQVAQEMIGQGADVIFGPAGWCGVGAVLTATQSSIWGIGTDTDYYDTVFENGAVEGSENLLTSVMKRADLTVYDTIETVYYGTFTPGSHLYDLSNDGVGLAPFHEAAPYVSPAMEAQLEDIRQGIINGEIDVNTPCERYSTYLPLVLRQ
jgi:basic membrane lipoprotein Med (substrate-binding protein (PBP1-ABC) superfamily)